MCQAGIMCQGFGLAATCGGNGGGGGADAAAGN
jgi:hypothetical protein